MKISALGTIFGAIALAGVAVLYLEVDKLSDRVESLSRRPVAVRKTPAEGSDRLVSRGRVAPRGTDVAEARAAEVDEAGTAEPAAPRTLEERIGRLERSLAQREEADENTYRMPRALAHRPRVRSMDQLSKRLELTPTQRSRVEQAIERGKQRIEDVMKIPDASGKSPAERRAESRKKLEEAVKNRERGGLLAFATDMFNYQGNKIPGRNTTYGEEIDRIKQETRDEVSSALSTEQQKTFADTNIDPMVGAEGGMQFSMITTHDEGGNGTAAGTVIVEAGASIVDEAEDDAGAPPPPEKDDG